MHGDMTGNNLACAGRRLQNFQRMALQIYEAKWVVTEKKNLIAQQDPERMVAKLVS